jgi:hypothetical protein
MKVWLVVAAAVALPVCRSASQVGATAPSAPIWSLSEDLRVGGGDNTASHFDDVRGIVATKNGTIFILDYRAQQIRVFDAKGGFVRLAADSGTGPGSIVSGNGLAVGPDDIVWVNDPRNHRFSLYAANGQFVRQIPNPTPTSTPVWEGVIDQSGRAIDLPVTIITTRADPETHLPITESGIRLVHPDGKADTLSYPNCQTADAVTTPFFQFQRADGSGGMVRAIPFLSKQLVVATPSDMVWCTPSSVYRLMTGPTGGALKEVVQVDMTPVPIPADLRQQAVDRVDSIVKAYGPLLGGSTEMIPRNTPVIASVNVDDQQHVWVRRTNMPEDAPLFDVFDPTGRLIASVHGAGAIGAQVFIAGDELLTLGRNATGEQIVIRYHITRP